MTTLPNIVWITLESTRFDHTSLSERGKETTPNIKRIADDEGGCLFRNCFSHGVWTLASSASILTGTYPTRHGAGIDTDAIPASFVTLPELLGEAGYTTACLSPNAHLSSATGLDRGFDEFSWIGKSTLHRSVGIRTVVKYLARLRTHGAGYTPDTRRHGTGYMVTDAAKRWLRGAEKDEPHFLYLHYGDPHHPYFPPRPYFHDAVSDYPLSTDEAAELALSHHSDLHQLIADGCPFTDTEWDVLTELYDGGIRYVDSLVGSLFDYVQSLSIGETVFVITSDHGELFGEDRLLSHIISVDDAVSHVPLVVHGLDAVHGYTGDFVQHIDVATTLLESLGLGHSQFQGVDLRRAEREQAFVQRGGDRCRQNLEKIAEHDPSFDTSRFHQSTVTALRTSDFKYVSSDEGSELYRLPDEMTDVSNEYPSRTADQEATVSEWLETEANPAEGERRQEGFSEEMESQLRELGYLVD